MSKNWKLGMGLAMVAVVLGPVAMWGLNDHGHAQEADEEKEVKPMAVMRVMDDMKFMAYGPEIGWASLWGDSAKGAYGAVVRLKAGGGYPVHTRPGLVRFVVVKGSLAFASGNQTKTLKSGAFLEVPAGLAFSAKADGKEECVCVETSDGAFGMKMVPAPK